MNTRLIFKTKNFGGIPSKKFKINLNALTKDLNLYQQELVSPININR